MLRAIVACVLAVPIAVSAQAVVGVLHIKVVLQDADGRATPVARHALLVSDDPPSAAPRRIVLSLDGTADVKLRPGRYIVESDRPAAFRGNAYQWIQTVEIAAGQNATLELTAENAEVGPVTSDATASAASSESDPTFLLNEWETSVVALWTPATRATGFVIDPRGLILTSQKAIGKASAVEVQLSESVKLAARVLEADSARDVAILWIDAAALSSVKPVPLGCAESERPPVTVDQEIFTIGSPLRGPKGLTSGSVSRADSRAMVSDFDLSAGSAGGPVFTSGGVVIGLTAFVSDEDIRRGVSPIVRIDEACALLPSVEKTMAGGAPPSGARLPVEPTRPFPVDALQAAAAGRAGSLNPYQLTSADFDIGFITPVQTYGAQNLSLPRTTSADTRKADFMTTSMRSLMEFGAWSEYVADFPPVLLVRATPRFVESFWTKVGRAAAQTQGVGLPPIKRFRPGFARMKVFCGETEVTPIHPFTLEMRVSETDAITEGLYVFDPGALGTHCGSVKLVLYSEKDPEKGDTRIVDPKVLQRIWQDFEPYRAS